MVVLQVHYNTATADGAPDQSSIDLMFEPEVERLGAFAPWLDIAWTYGSMNIPAGAEDVLFSVHGDPVGFFEMLLGDGVDLSNGFDIHAAMLHMHTLGRSGSVSLYREDGAIEMLLEVDAWDFNWQFNYQFVEAVPFVPTDQLHLECTFDNPTAEDVTWGEGTGDEMCVGNLFVSAPR